MKSQTQSIFQSTKQIATSTASFVTKTVDVAVIAIDTVSNELITMKINNSINNISEVVDTKKSALNDMYTELDVLSAIKAPTERQKSELEDLRLAIKLIKDVDISAVARN
jgi:hypothetical protein